MSISQISPLPQPPQRSDAPDVFAGRADAFVAALLPFREQVNQLGGDVQAAVAGNLVNFDGFAGVWSAGTFNAGQVVFHTPSDAFYIALEDNETAEPAGGNWRKIGITSAEDVDYENASSGLAATNVQDAVDEVQFAVDEVTDNPYVVQTVTADTDTTVSLSTGTFTDIGLSASITPKFSDSKILIMAAISMNQRRDNDSVLARVQLLKDGSSVMSVINQDDRSTANIRSFEFPIPFYYDEVVSSTDELTFTFQGNCGKTTNAGRVDFNTSRSTLVIMEIKQ